MPCRMCWDVFILALEGFICGFLVLAAVLDQLQFALPGTAVGDTKVCFVQMFLESRDPVLKQLLLLILGKRQGLVGRIQGVL